MEKLQKFILYAVGIYHIGLGSMGFLSTKLAAKITLFIFGMNLQVNPQMSYIAKLLGVYVIIFGIIMIVAATNPEKYKVIINIAVVLYVARFFERIIFLPAVQESFNISTFRIWFEAGLLAFFALILFLVKPKKA